MVPNLVNILVQSTVNQALTNYTNSISLESSIDSLLIIASFYQDCFSMLEHNSEHVFRTLVSALEETTSSTHRLVLLHTITQICQIKKDYIDDYCEVLLAVLSQVINQIDIQSKDMNKAFFRDTTQKTRDHSIRLHTKCGVFLESGIILTFLHTLLQVTEY